MGGGGGVCVGGGLSVLGVRILPWVFRGSGVRVYVCGGIVDIGCFSIQGMVCVGGGRVFSLIPISLYMVFRFHQGYPGEWSCGGL